MPEYLTPGVYVEEVPSGAKPIAGVPTSTAGFAGGTERGPLAPQFISSWIEFLRLYGTYVPNQSYLAYAVEGFFANGGTRCFITRVVGAGAASAKGELSGAGEAKVEVQGIGPGAWGDRIKVAVTKSSLAEMTQNADEENAKLVKVTIELMDGNGKVDKTEVFDNLSHETERSWNIIQMINTASQLIRVNWEDETKTGALGQDQTSQLSGGSDGSPLTAGDFDGHIDQIETGSDLLGRSTGLAALEIIDEISLLVVPDEAKIGSPLTDKVIAQCEKLKDRFAIISAAENQNSINILRPPKDSSYGAFYYPWVKVYDPSIDNYRKVPPSGHVAGIYARTDIQQGVHKAPANEVVLGVVDLEFPITKAKQDVLNPRGVNCLRDFRSDGRGIRLWGARTMSSDPEWRYVNVRRLFLFVEESIEEGTQWVVFELNDESTWDNVQRSVSNFLTTVWRSGALMGTTQNEAFFARCDRTTMTQDDIDNGRLVFVVGIAPVKPAEFVIFRISQKTA